MKLSLAAALLGQTIPTLSKRLGPTITARDRALKLTTEILEDTSPQLTLDNGRDKQQSGWHYNRRLKRQMVRNNLKNVPKNGFESMIVPCDPRSTDPDVGILSCAQGSTCEPSVTSSLGGVCTPLRSSHQDQELGPDDAIVPWKQVAQLVDHLPSVESVQCDPTSIDIGILACGEGQFCKHDETSGLGGYCVDTTTSSSRRLAPYYLEDLLYNCYYPPGYPVACDCSGVNVSKGSGTMYCTQNFTAEYVYGCDEYVVYDSFSYSFDNSVLVKVRDCYETTTPFTESICFLLYVEGTELVCDAEWNGQRCTSCALTNYAIAAFDCSNVDGGRVGDSRKELLSVFDLCSNTTCSNFCGEGSFIPESSFPINVDVAGDNFTCGQLAYFEENPMFPDVYCPYVLEAAQTYCCTINSTAPSDDDTTSSGGGSSTPGPESEDNSTIPAETDEEEDGSSVPGADSGQDSTSAGRSLWNFALVACEAAVVMALVSRV